PPAPSPKRGGGARNLPPLPLWGRGAGGIWSSLQQIDQVIPAHPPDQPRESPRNLLGILFNHPAHFAVDAGLKSRTAGLSCPFRPTDRPDFRRRAVRQNDAQSPHVIDRLAVDDRSGAG